MASKENLIYMLKIVLMRDIALGHSDKKVNIYNLGQMNIAKYRNPLAIYVLN